MEYCPHCMRPVTGGGSCPNCGGDVSWTGQKGIDLPVGTVFSGDNDLRTYRVGAARGKGGFGITYVALETNSGRRVAIKEYFPTRCAFRGGNGVDVQAMTGQEEPFKGGMKSFLEEGKMLLAQDDLPCVVHVIDYFQANGTAYLVMEYLDGVALHAQMTRMGGRIPVGELMPRLALLMRDIGQLHQRGVIHRDISPDNIMWMPDGGLKLLDFGSARSMESGKSMTVLMKQGFSPIEQYRSKGQGPYTDIYALAATIYYCITGVIPPSSMERLGEDTLQSPIALGAALTVQQETALLWALSIQPDGRPQSMEEFAAMLYKEGPAAVPPGPAPANGSYTPPQVVRPQSERPVQVPPQPVTEQNPGYSYGQVPPQPVTERSSGYSYGQSYSGQSAGAGQPIGQYGGGSVTPGQNRSGGNKKLPIIIGAAAAVIVAALIGVFVWMGGNGEDVIEESDRPSHGAQPSYSYAPSPTLEFPPTTVEPTEDAVTGVTDDGFYYEIIDQDHVVLTGCLADANFGYMPDDVDGIPITGIADGAFAGADTGDIVNLPYDLETIGANAFRGCADLLYVAAYSSVVTDSSSFSGCPNIWCVTVRDPDISGWKLPGGTTMYYFGMDVERGTLKKITRDGGVLTGETSGGETVLLDVWSGMGDVSGLDDVDWICSWALDNMPSGTAVNLGPETIFPYALYGKASWSAPDGSRADSWLLTCRTADAINDYRSNANRMQPDAAVMEAGIARAWELAEGYDIYVDTRPDGRDGWSALSDEGVTYQARAGVYGGEYYDKDELDQDIIDYIVGNYAQTTDSGSLFTKIGVGRVRSDGQYYAQIFLLVP